MKILEETADRLVIEDKPWFLGALMIILAMVFLSAAALLASKGEVIAALLFGLIGGGVPLLIAAVMVQRVRMTFDRASGRVRHAVRSVRGFREEERPLDRLTGASVTSSADSDGVTYRMQLHFDAPAETMPFTSYHTSGRKPQVLCDAVNRWLAQGRGPRP